MAFSPSCHICECIMLQVKGDFVDVIKITNQLTLKWGDFPGLSGWITWIISAIMWALKHRVFFWLETQGKAERLKHESDSMCYCWFLTQGAREKEGAEARKQGPESYYYKEMCYANGLISLWVGSFPEPLGKSPVWLTPWCWPSENPVVQARFPTSVTVR